MVWDGEKGVEREGKALRPCREVKIMLQGCWNSPKELNFSARRHRDGLRTDGGAGVLFGGSMTTGGGHIRWGPCDRSTYTTFALTSSQGALPLKDNVELRIIKEERVLPIATYS